jgi:hypothetical protein
VCDHLDRASSTNVVIDWRFKAYLDTLHEVRVHVDGSPNFGHQASSLLLLQRIAVDYTYEGLITVLYDDARHGEPSSVDKLCGLLGQSPNAPPLTLARAHLRWWRLAEVSSLDWIPFGLSGGSDPLRTPNLATAMQVHVCLALQPFQWRYAPDQILFDDGTPGLSLIDYLGWRFFLRAYRLPRGLPGRRSHDPRGEPPWAWLESSGPPVALSPAQPLLLAPTYGVRERGVCSVDAAHLFAVLMLVLLRLTDTVAASAVVVNFDKHWPEAWRRLRALFLARDGGSPDGEVNNAFAACLARAAQDRHAADRTAFVRKASVGEGLSWAASARGRILFVEHGFAPQRVLLAALASATLPVVCEGQATVTAAVSLGKPYLHLPDAGAIGPVCFARRPDDTYRHGTSIKHAEHASRSLFSAANGTAPLESATATVAEFVSAACLTTDTPEARYFEDLGNYYTGSGADKLDAAIAALMSVLQPRDSG